MIDTVKLRLDYGLFRITAPNKFSPSVRELYGYQGEKIICIQNPTKRELQKGIYKPKLTMIRKKISIADYKMCMMVEFSIPKLLYKNNFDEVEESQFNDVLEALIEKLNIMGVEVHKNILRLAPVSVIHFSKNIPLTDYSTPLMYLSSLTKVNMAQRLDLNNTNFRNGGHSLKYHANSYEIAFYDKLKDLAQAKKSEKRAEEKDNALQFNLLNRTKFPIPFEVLRMEVRFNKPSAIRQILRKVDMEKRHLDFYLLFNETISQKILLHYLNIMEEKYPKLLLGEYKNPQEFLINLRINDPTLKFPKAVQLFGLTKLLEETGARGVKELAQSYNYNKRNLERLYKDSNEVANAEDFMVFSRLREALEKFEILRLRNYTEGNKIIS